MENKKRLSGLDKTITVFIIIFLASLGNSIFVNQIGYYGALLLLLAKYFLTRENGFKKTGLEIYFLLFIAAELISSFLSINQPQSFNNLLKRVLLLPIIYVITAGFDDLKKLKTYFYVYIGASILTICFYLFKSYDYFVNNLFQIKQSGPASLQHPITAGEIISFTVIFLFAFIVNEKQKLRDKAFTIFLFFIALAGLYATYKRTGWIGSAAGMGVILLFAKKWKLLIPMAAVVLLLVLFQSSASELNIYKYTNGKISAADKITTEGRPFNVSTVGNKLYLSDYNNGICEITETGEIINKLNTPSPVENLARINDSIYAAYLIDTRFLLIKNDGSSLRIEDVFTSPGETNSYAVITNKLYVNDRDSGLTILSFDTSPRVSRYTEINDIIAIGPGDGYFAALSSDKESIKIYESSSGLPETLQYVYIHDKPVEFFRRIHNDLLLGDREGLKLYRIDSLGLILLDENKKLQNLYNMNSGDLESKLFIATSGGNLYELGFPLNGKLSIISENNIGHTPVFISYIKGKIYTGDVRVGRIESIFDKYNHSNIGRLAFWEAGWRIFKDYPLFGVGDIDLAKIYIQYKYPYNKEIEGHMHNNYVHILVILGAAGFIILMILFIKIFLLLWKNYIVLREEKFLSSIALGALGCYAAFLISGLTEWNFGDHEIVTLLWTTIGISLSAVNIYKTRRQ